MYLCKQNHYKVCSSANINNSETKQNFTHMFLKANIKIIRLFYNMKAAIRNKKGIVIYNKNVDKNLQINVYEKNIQ